MRELLEDKYARLLKESKQLEKERANRIFEDAERMVGLYLYECTSHPRHPSDEFIKWKVTHYSSTPKDRHKVADKLGHNYYFPSCHKKPTKALVAECESYLEKYKDIPDNEFDVIFYVETIRKDINCKSYMGVRFNPDTGNFE